MIEVTGTAQRQAWHDDVLPPVERVRDGLWSIPVPIPNNPLRYVLVYALALPDGVAIVDSGWNTDESWAALCGGLGTAGYDVADVRAVLITHIHPDHFGLAGRVREASGAWVGIHEADASLLPARYGPGMAGLVTQMRDLLADCGVPDDELGVMSSASLGVRELVTLAEPDRYIDDGEKLDLPGWDLHAIWTPGHSPGHLCFAEPSRRLVLTGDHVLPRITPNVSMHTQSTTSPLADFMESLAKVRGCASDEVLPAHEWRFAGLAERVDDLLAHHHRRLDEIAAVVAASPGLTCWEVTTRLTWSRSWDDIQGFMRRAANGETLAHLIVLQTQGRIRSTGQRPQRWELVG